MTKEEGFMKCTGCGMVWKGTWDVDQEVTCPECGSPLEAVEGEDLREP